MGRGGHLFFAILGVAAALPSVAAGAPTPIPDDPQQPRPQPEFLGGSATPRGIRAAEPPRHPFMAPNARSNIHVDAFQTDSNVGPGPLGRGTTTSSTLKTADCASVTFDARGRIVTICVGVLRPTLEVLDPVTLDSLASMPLPNRNPGTGSIFQDFSGGGYFYLDERGRAIIPTNSRRLLVVAVRDRPGGGVELVTEGDYDLGGAVPLGDKIVSALPDWSGRLWFVSAAGVVGTLDLATGSVRSRPLGEPVTNSFAIDDSGGVYIVSERALYRFDAGTGGEPVVTWEETYRNSGASKPGQVGPGSGTTPTIMEDGRIAITDNADPMNVVVYRRGREVDGSRLICEQPVFERGASATDNSLIAARNSIVVENNHGYTGPTAVMEGRTTTPGMARVDVLPGDRGCRTVWTRPVIAPSVVPKLSLETGLVYTYTKPAREDGVDAWYLTTLDFCTGARIYSRLAGTGLGFNNNYAPVTLGPDGVAYLGVLGGLVRFADAQAPAGPPVGARPGCAPRPRLALRARRARGSCRVVARVAGRDRALVRGVRFRAGGRRARDRRAPFRRVLRAPRRRVRAKALVRLRDGRRVTLRRPVRRCGRAAQRERRG